MADGTINVWNPSKLSASDEALLVSVEQHQGAVPGLQFNPHADSAHLLASGGADGEVFVTSLENPEAPTVFVPAPPPSNAKHTADITAVAWNSQVVHILASAAQNGGCYIWDLRLKRAWCELRDPSGGVVSDVAWNPDQGLHIVTASGDDRNPVIKLWDLRSSTSLPLATLQGHTEGVLSVSWCPTDTSLLLSCGKDNRTILWDLSSLQAVYELPVREAAPSSFASEANVFGTLASSASHRRYHVAWSPALPAVVSAASFDRKVQFFSMSGAKSKAGRAPKWLRRPVGATFGFGGKLVKIDNMPNATGKKATGKLSIYQVEENPELLASSDAFHDLVARGSYKQFCEHKAQHAVDPEARKVWSLMNVICFDTNAREDLLAYFGFSDATITEAGKKYLASRGQQVEEAQAATSSAEDLFAAPATSPVPAIARAERAPHLQSKVDEVLDLVMSWEEAEPIIRRAMIVGNFELAVDCCLAAGLLAEALLLAQCGDQELRFRTQAAFFERQRNKHPFLNVLYAVIKRQLMDFVQTSDLKNWKETLAMLSTYGKTENFPFLAETLAGRLEDELGDKASAALCFMCANNVPRTIKYWTEELVEANNRLGQLDTQALQDYVEKIMVFTHYNPTENLGVECGTFFARYGELLVNQGRLTSATTYVMKGSSTAEHILMDRIYHAGSKPAGSRPPAFPFTKTTVDAVSATAAATVAKGPRSAVAIAAATGSTASTAYDNPAPAVRSNFAPHPANTRANPMSAEKAAAPTPTPVPAPTTPMLAAGWLQMFDPNTNHPYYVNQATGASQWEMPQAAPTAALPPTPTAAVAAVSSPMAAPYPQAAAYPHSISMSHAPAAVAHPVEAVAPVAAPAAAAAPIEADCVIALGQMIEAIAAASLNPQEKKQLAVIRTSYGALCDKLRAGELSENILMKLTQFMDHIANRNYPGASAIQTVSALWFAAALCLSHL